MADQSQLCARSAEVSITSVGSITLRGYKVDTVHNLVHAHAVVSDELLHHVARQGQVLELHLEYQAPGV